MTDPSEDDGAIIETVRRMLVSHGLVPVIDPTRNVLDLVRDERRYQDAMRAAEQRRVDQLAVQRHAYETRMAAMLVQSSQELATRVAALEHLGWRSEGRGSVEIMKNAAMWMLAIASAGGLILAIYSQTASHPAPTYVQAPALSAPAR